MSDYRVEEGFDQALVDLDVIVPQPTSGGIRPTVRTYSTGGNVTELAPYAELTWSVIETPTEYTTLLAMFGLDDALQANVTVYIRNEFFAYARYNAVAQRPMIGNDANWEQYFLRNVTIVLTHLEAL